MRQLPHRGPDLSARGSHVGPEKVIYYLIESIPFYGDFDVEMNRRAGPLLDVVIFSGRESRGNGDRPVRISGRRQSGAVQRQ